MRANARFLAFGVCFMMFLGSAAARAETTIGITIDRFDDVFISLMKDAMEAHLKTLPDVKATIVSAENNVNTQEAQVKDFIDKGVDALLVMAVDETKGKALADMAAAAGKPIVFVSRRLPETNFNGPTTMVSANDLVAGRLQMRILANLLGGKGSIVILKGLGSAADARTQGFNEVLKSQPGIKVVAQEVGEWQRAKGKAIVEKWLKSGLTFDAVAANNDEMAIGAVEALRDAGLAQGKILVGGVDATAAALKVMKEGDLAVTVKQNAQGLGTRSVDDAVKLAKGQVVPLYDWVPFELVTPKVLDRYLTN